jgi:uncharacterized protein YjbI with pentapeptide repeats
MDENHQEKTESKLAATEDKSTSPPLSSEDQSKPEQQAHSHVGKAFTKPSSSKAIHNLLAIALSIAMVGVIVLIYLCFKLNWSLWSLISLTLVGILVLIFLIREGYYAQWTGFRGYVKETKEYTDGQSTTTTRDQQPGKTLWDWLQLLIIPIVLASATLGFGWWQANLANQQHLQDQASALDQQQATILQTYIDNIQDLLLNHHLLNSSPRSDVAILARARTLTALQGLDPKRKGTLVQFIYEAKLIGFFNPGTDATKDIIEPPIIELNRADLSGADLFAANLSEANLSTATLFAANLREAILIHANLNDADLVIADLSGAHLSGASFRYAYLSGAHLTGADLRDANLFDAYLRGADLSTTNLTQQQLDQVLSCKDATLPPGLTCHLNQSSP